VWDRVSRMMQSTLEDPRFPPTVLYNENWMLRLVLDRLVDRGTSSLVPVAPGATWYSEALLPSAFLARFRGDPLAESYTHADGVVGHFRIGGNGKGDLVLLPEAAQLTVIEGKMFSKLSSGVSNARYFDQAARNVACIAQVLCVSNLSPADVGWLGFHLVAPREQITLGVFEDLVTKESIRGKVRRRVAEYEGGRDDWLERWFLPTLDRLEVGVLSWEELVDEVVSEDEEVGRRLEEFYQMCVRFNSSSVPVVADDS
jgi:hypothetical protein